MPPAPRLPLRHGRPQLRRFDRSRLLRSQNPTVLLDVTNVVVVTTGTDTVDVADAVSVDGGAVAVTVSDAEGVDVRGADADAVVVEAPLPEVTVTVAVTVVVPDEGVGETVVQMGTGPKIIGG
ncbi:hypothetical protein TRAPUB_11663 [Trametes pubescens]|uniref:Uncharacterized protein n=1 Tax=Trametes pubescens TaxID=154538 RepID=A0A1M2VW97_TRAPU|nr:hypothetical protein TRAPUB_11663 [Trametes pubescens]